MSSGPVHGWQELHGIAVVDLKKGGNTCHMSMQQPRKLRTQIPLSCFGPSASEHLQRYEVLLVKGHRLLQVVVQGETRLLQLLQIASHHLGPFRSQTQVRYYKVNALSLRLQRALNARGHGLLAWGFI